MKDKTIGRVLLYFLLISASLIVSAILAVRNISRSAVRSDWVNHTHAVILEVAALQAALAVGDSALHIYAFTGDPRDQAACRGALADITEHMEITRALTRNEPAQHEQVLRLEPLVDQRASFYQAVLATRQTDHPEAARALLAADDGRAGLREIRQKIDRLKDDELARLTEQDTAAYLQAQATRWTLWVGVVLDVLMLGGVAWLLRDDLAARRRVALALQADNQQLEARVQARTAELAAANARLSTENLERQWANKALEHQLHYNQLIVDSIEDLVFVLTKGLRISRVNPAVVRLTGLEPAALINQPLSEVVRLLAAPAPADAPMIDPIYQALKDGHELRNRSATVADKRGRTTPVRFTLFPLRDGNKVVGGIVTLQLIPAGAERKA
jgi:PAS domain S-box-containing protein